MQQPQYPTNTALLTDPNQLTTLIQAFITAPTPEVELRLAHFHPQPILALLADTNHPRNFRAAAAMALKALLSNRSLFQPHLLFTLHHLQQLYTAAPPEVLVGIEGSLEVVLEKLMELYLDDQRKLKVFEDAIEEMCRQAEVGRSRQHHQTVKLALLLVRSMDVTTLNNEVCIGSLIAYLKQLYYEKYQTSDPNNISGRGLQLLTAAMQGDPLQWWVETQVAVVQTIREILLKVQQQDGQEMVPTAYIRNSKQIQKLLQGMICCGDGTIYGRGRAVNELKCQLLQLYSQNYLYHIDRHFLNICLNTVVQVQPQQLVDRIDDIIAEVLQLLQRSTSYADYADYFYNSTQLLILKLFEFIAIGQAERQTLQDDPQHFVEIADDFCKTQESNSVKCRAGSLIHSLCLSVDGNLTFVGSMCLIPLHFVEWQCIQQTGATHLMRAAIAKAESTMTTLLDLWSKGSEELIESAILITASISDLLLKRPQVAQQVSLHLGSMHLVLQQEAVMSPLILCRYIQLVSFFSFPGCLDPFLRYFRQGRAYEESLLKALQTITHYYDKKQEEMRQYVSQVTTSMLMMSDRITPMLESTIINRPAMIAPIKERLVEKLVNWLQNDYAGNNQFGCNKLSNLLTKVIDAYPQLAPDTPYDLTALTHYLTPLYKQMLASSGHHSEECIIDIAVQHVECLGPHLDLPTALQFMHMAIQVVRNNHYVLNKCLELFSRLLARPHSPNSPPQSNEYSLQQVHAGVAVQLLPLLEEWAVGLKEERDIDIWQVAFLTQLVVVALWKEQHPPLSHGLLQQLHEWYLKTKASILKIKIYQVMLVEFISSASPASLAYNFLQANPIPHPIPPHEKHNFSIYLTLAVNLVPTPTHKAHLLLQAIQLMYPSQSYASFLKNYEDTLYCSRTDDSETEIAALQAAKEVLHPLQSRTADIYQEFRQMFSQMTAESWEQVRPLVASRENHIRDALVREVVGKTPRRILKIKSKEPLA